MGHFKVNEKDIFFILKDQLNYGGLCSLERYRDLNEETLDMVVSAAITFARGVLDPLQEIGERWGVRYEGGKVHCAPEFGEAFRRYGNNGWIAVARDRLYGGQGLPHMMRVLVNDQMYGACQSFNMAPSLTHGAGHLIESFGAKGLREQFVPKMYEGQWSGTMCLTEPHAGSHLGDIRTAAVRYGDHYWIRGTKTFISYGDHDMTENIVHLVLARIQGAPEGVGGISLFVVPKIRVNPERVLGGPNDVICTGIERKLGLHASPTCTLNFGEQGTCIGYLCGEANKGLLHMFQMVNQARINSAVSGMTLASTAFRNALSYTRERIQGTDLAGRKPGVVPIIDHPDIRRMLLWMKGMVDGMRSMIYSTALWSDLALELPRGEERNHYRALVDFMTPILKAYCSDMGFRVCETAVQCLGGYGYCREYPLEQYLRDEKILSLYEGTNGIQAMDLIGRKMRLKGGGPFDVFIREIRKFLLKQGSHPLFGRNISALAEAVDRLEGVTRGMLSNMDDDPLQSASYAYPMLITFGDLILLWRLLDMAVIAHSTIQKTGRTDFLLGKVLQAAYMAGTLLPVARARLETCRRSGREIVDMPEGAF